MIMWVVSACLLPAGAWGVYVFGARAAVTVLAAVLSAVIFEALAALVCKEFTLWDGSAFLTGLLVGYNMPPEVNLYVPVMASAFAILVVKWTFGGLGGNWMNPALAGRVFVFFSWTGSMTRWTMPKTWAVDAVSSATPLGFLKTRLMDLEEPVGGSIDLLNIGGYPASPMGERIAHRISEAFGWSVDPLVLDQFIGNVPGCIGEVSAILILLGGVILLILGIANWEIPLAYLATFGVLTWILGGVRYGSGYFNGDFLVYLFSGGLFLGAFFMATDMVTSPLSRMGMIIFGAGAGFLTFLIRYYGSFPEGVSLAIILMNIFVPAINRITEPKRFGIRKAEEPGR